jgi:hypothetical protein
LAHTDANFFAVFLSGEEGLLGFTLFATGVEGRKTVKGVSKDFYGINILSHRRVNGAYLLADFLSHQILDNIKCLVERIH